MKVHHIGYLVQNIEKAKKAFLDLGYSAATELHHDTDREIFILFMEKDGYVVELVAPNGENSVVAGLSKRLRNSPYHICYESDSFELDITDLRKKGFMPISKPARATALEGRDVLFLMHPQLGIAEIIRTE